MCHVIPCCVDLCRRSVRTARLSCTAYCLLNSVVSSYLGCVELCRSTECCHVIPLLCWLAQKEHENSQVILHSVLLTECVMSYLAVLTSAEGAQGQPGYFAQHIAHRTLLSYPCCVDLCRRNVRTARLSCTAYCPQNIVISSAYCPYLCRRSTRTASSFCTAFCQLNLSCHTLAALTCAEGAQVQPAYFAQHIAHRSVIIPWLCWLVQKKEKKKRQNHSSSFRFCIQLKTNNFFYRARMIFSDYSIWSSGKGCI